MKQTIKDIFTSKIEPWVILLSASLSFLVYLNFFLKLDNTPLKNFHQRSIGITIVSGLDASPRTTVYVSTILAFIGCFLAAYVLLTLFSYFIRTSIPARYVSIEKSVISTLSGFSLTMTLLAILLQPLLKHVVFLLLAFIGFTCLIICIKIRSFHRQQYVLRIYSDYHLMIFALMVPYVLFFVYWVISDGDFTFTAFHIVGYFLGVFIFLAGYPFWLKFTSLSHKTLSRSLVVAGIPLTCIPLSIPFSNELQFTLTRVWVISPRSMTWISLMILITASFTFWFLSIHTTSIRWHPARLITYIYFPMFLASMVVFKHYRHYMIVTEFDLFHLGEQTLPTQQIFSFGNLPWIDFFPTHGLSDMFFQMLYSLVNGYRGVEMLLWRWLWRLVATLLFYFLLTKFTRPLFSLLTVLLLPLQVVFRISGTISAESIFLPLLVLPWAIKKPSLLRLTVLWSSVLLVGFWRYDSGIASTIAMMCILVSLCIYSHDGSWKSFLRKVFSLPIASCVLVFGTVFGCYTILVMLKGLSIYELLAPIFAFLKNQTTARVYLSFFRKFSPLVVTQYLVLPMVSIAYILWFSIKVIIRKERFSPLHPMLACLAICSLILSVRSVHRHSLIEQFRPFAFSFLFCAIPFYFTKIRTSYSQGIFLSSFLLFVFLFPTKNIVQLRPGPLFRFTYWENDTSRLIVKNDSQYAHFVKFLETFLQRDQTYFDFANAPMLYVFANRKFPSFIIPNLAQTSETIQRHLLKKLHSFSANNQLPFILFKQGHRAWDQADGVPNEVRSYRIAEFIYTHYQPLGMIDKYEIWSQRGKLIGSPDLLRPITSIAQKFDLKKLPYIWGTYDEYQAVTATAILATLWNSEKPIPFDIPLTLPINISIDKSTGNYVHFSIRSQQEGKVTIRYGTQNPSVVSFDLIASERYEDYLVRISTQWSWMNESISSLSLESSVQIDIRKIVVRKGD